MLRALTHSRPLTPLARSFGLMLMLMLLLLIWPRPVLAHMDFPVSNPVGAELLAGNPWVERIQKRGVLRVGFDIFRPWAMQAKKGDYLGFEVQVAQALAADMGVKVKFVPTAWDGIIPALLTGRFDIIIGGMGITPERAKRVVFTEPYVFAGMTLAASKITAPGLSSLDDFNKSHIKIAVKGGTTAAIAAKKTFPLAQIIEFDDEGQSTQELRGGRAQALVAAAPYPAQQALKNYDEIYIPVPETFAKEPCGMALSPKNKDALPALDVWIAARFTSGWLDHVRDYWFKDIQWEGQLN